MPNPSRQNSNNVDLIMQVLEFPVIPIEGHTLEERWQENRPLKVLDISPPFHASEELEKLYITVKQFVEGNNLNAVQHTLAQAIKTALQAPELFENVDITTNLKTVNAAIAEFLQSLMESTLTDIEERLRDTLLPLYHQTIDVVRSCIAVILTSDDDQKMYEKVLEETSLLEKIVEVLREALLKAIEECQVTTENQKQMIDLLEIFLSYMCFEFAISYCDPFKKGKKQTATLYIQIIPRKIRKREDKPDQLSDQQNK